MYLKGIFKVVVALLLVVAVVGCGSGNSNTNGTIVLTADAPQNAGFVNLKATAALTPVQLGAIVHFTARMYDATGVIAGPFSADIATNDAGVTSPFNWVPKQSTTGDATLEVVASIGGLSDLQNINIPKFVP